MLLMKYKDYGEEGFDWTEEEEMNDPVCDFHLPDRSTLEVRWDHRTLRDPKLHPARICSNCGMKDIGLVDLYQCCVCQNCIICYRCYRNGFHALVHPFTTIEIGDTSEWTSNLRVRRGAKQELFKVLGNPNDWELTRRFPTHTISMDKGTRRKRKTSLFIAMLFGDVEFIKGYIEKGMNVDYEDGDGDTLLHYAVFGNHTEIIKLLAKSPYINKCNNQGKTPLHCAAQYSTPECVNILLAAKAEHDIGDYKGNKALHCATIGRNVENLKLLLAAEVNVEATNCTGCTALYLATLHQTVECATILLEAGANPNCKRYLDCTPLHEAAQNPSPILDLLVKSGSKVNASDRLGTTALQILATSSKNPMDVEKLLTAGADPNMTETSGITALHKAAKSGPANLKLLLDAGSELNAVDNRGRTALHFAVNEECEQSIQILLGAGIDGTIKNALGYTAVHEAARNGKNIILRLMLDGGVDPNLKDSRGNTPLHLAVQDDQFGAVHILCSSRKLDVTLKNDRGYNVLHEAALRGNASATSRILQRAPELVDTQTTEKGYTALHLSIGYPDVLNSLLKLGKADANLKTFNGNCALEMAVKDSQQMAVEALVSYKADVNMIDADGNSILHISALKLASDSRKSSGRTDVIGDMFRPMKATNFISSSDIETVCYLIAAGANIYWRNSQGQTVLDIVKNPDMVTVMKGFRPPAVCKYCLGENEENVRLEPCQHAPACIHCSTYMKKCLVCHVPIQERLIMKDNVVKPKSPRNVLKKITELEKKVAKLESRQDGFTCSICMDRPKSIVFGCGHSCCKSCARILWTCHICREGITLKLKMT